MIVRGNIQTAEGPVAVENIRIDDLVIDRERRARRITAIKTAKVTETVSFKRNTKAVFSSDTVFLTAKGTKTLADGAGVSFIKPDGRSVSDTAVIAATNTIGYNLTVEDGSNVYVSGYNVEV